MDRLALLKDFLKEDPDDPFNTYALALEYQKDNIEEAVSLFEDLVRRHPNYLPTYYPFAQLLIETQTQSQKIESIFKQGIETARRLNDQKALKELNNAYSNWLFEQS
jgi:hypothetical protein